MLRSITLALLFFGMASLPAQACDMYWKTFGQKTYFVLKANDVTYVTDDFEQHMYWVLLNCL